MNIYVDFDDTLVDLTGEWLNWLKKERGIKVKPSDVTKFDYLSDKYGESVNDFWRTEGVYKKIKTFPASVEFMKILMSMYGKENVFIISHTARNMISEKQKIGERVFGILPNNFLHVQDKWNYTSDGILIDDLPRNVLNHVKGNNRPGIIFNYRNKNGWSNSSGKSDKVFVAYDFAECLKMVKYFEKYFKDINN